MLDENACKERRMAAALDIDGMRAQKRPGEESTAGSADCRQTHDPADTHADTVASFRSHSPARSNRGDYTACPAGTKAGEEASSHEDRHEEHRAGL